MESNQSGFLSGLGQTLLTGLRTAIDGEALQRYGTYGGQVVQDRSGDVAPVGTPFRDTAEVVSSPTNWMLIGVIAGLGLLLILRR